MAYYGRYTAGRDFSQKKSHANNELKIDKELLKSLLGTIAPSGEEAAMSAFILNWISANKINCNYTIDKNANIFITKGKATIYPCVVAHMDEVCGDTKARRIIELDNVIMGINPRTGEWAGCPGDDRVGCYVALEMLLKLPECKVAFFVEEEVGARNGSGSVDLKFFNNVAFILQVDRAGDSELIMRSNGGDICGKDFIAELSWLGDSYSYRWSDGGTFTDCGVLSSRGVGVSCINLGAGYFDNHSYDEKVCITSVENVLNIVNVICTQYAWKRWSNVFKSGYSTSNSYSKYKYKHYGYNEEDFDDESWRADLMNYNNKGNAALLLSPTKSNIAIEEVDFQYMDLDTLPCNSCKTYNCTVCPFAAN